MLTTTGTRPSAATTIASRRVLLADGRIAPAELRIDESGHIEEVHETSPGAAAELVDLLLLPGIVDVHGDAFERAISPRPGTIVPLQLGLVENDRQLLAAGITTSFLSATDSWEPGLRSRQTLRELVAALGHQTFGAEVLLHVRHEQTNTDDHDELLGWIDDGRVAMLSLNDHAPTTIDDAAAWVHRVRRLDGCQPDAVVRMAEDAVRRRVRGEQQVRELCACARRRGVVVASHDVDSLDQVERDASLGVTVAEFPYTIALAQLLRDRGSCVVMGAPNVVRGGSHLGNLAVAEAVRAGAVDVLCSDYHYPSLLLAPFFLAAEGHLSFADAWQLVSAGPARAALLPDRGRLAPGTRADVIAVDDRAQVPTVRRAWRAGEVVADFGVNR
jgi:alpha-D-ribose 1-methylphosphonate 5-triphosphate diphosphatase